MCSLAKTSSSIMTSPFLAGSNFKLKLPLQDVVLGKY
jgi:hypothetical protein